MSSFALSAPVFLFVTDAEFWANLPVDGLSRGSIYALIALGYTMVYGVLQLINFAHGEVFMIGSFAGYFVLVDLFGGTEVAGAMAAVAIVVALLVAGVTSGLTAAVIERVAYRPLRHAPRLAPLSSAIGVSVFLSALANDYFLDGESRQYPSIFTDKDVSLGPVTVTFLQLFLMASSLAFMFGLYWIVQRTRTGRAIRAVSENRDNAALMGVDVNRTIVITFILGGILAGFGGVLYGLFLNTIRGTMGFLPGIKAFTAAVLGGIGSIPGAVVGGFVLGLTETVGREFLNQLPILNLPSEWQDVVAFAVLVVVLLVRPTGIFRQRESKRA